MAAPGGHTTSTQKHSPAAMDISQEMTDRPMSQQQQPPPPLPDAAPVEAAAMAARAVLKSLYMSLLSPSMAMVVIGYGS